MIIYQKTDGETMIQRASVSLDEQEETLNYFPKQSSERMTAYSCIPAGIRYYHRLLEECPNDVTLIHEDKYGIQVELPASWYRRPKPKGKRVLTDEQREAAAERLREARMKKEELNMDE